MSRSYQTVYVLDEKQSSKPNEKPEWVDDERKSTKQPSVLDNKILGMLKSTMISFYSKHNNQHVNGPAINLLQNVIDSTFNWKDQALTKESTYLLCEWVTKWWVFQNESLTFFKKAGPILITHYPNRNQAVDYSSFVQASNLHPNLIIFDTFVVSIWTLLLNVFTKKNIKFELGPSAVSILDESSLKELKHITGKEDESFFKIPFDFLNNVGLINLFILEKLGSLVFRDSKGPVYKDCFYNEDLKFSGEFVLKHLLLLMVSGLDNPNCQYGRAMHIYDTIRRIMENLHPVRVSQSKSTIEPLTSATVKALSDVDEEKFQWLVRCYQELLECREILVNNPKRVFNIIFHYCACKVVCIGPDDDSDGAKCCSFCHNKCHRWDRSLIGRDGDFDEDKGSFYQKLGEGVLFQNLLDPLPIFSSEQEPILDCL